MADFSSLSDLPDDEFAKWLTIEHGVASVPGSSFYYSRPELGRTQVRFAFCKTEDMLGQGGRAGCSACATRALLQPHAVPRRVSRSLARDLARESEIRRQTLDRSRAGMQSQQIQADRFECRHRVFEPLLYEITLDGEIGDDTACGAPRNRRIGTDALVGVRQRLLQLLEPRPRIFCASCSSR